MRVGNFDDDIRSPSPFDIENDNDIRTDSGLVTKLNNVIFLREHLKTLDDPEALQEYKLSKKRYFDMISILPTALVFTVSAVTRYNWENIGSKNPIFLVSNLIILITTIIFWTYFVSHCLVYYSTAEKRKKLIYRISEYILLSSFGGRIEDVICFFTTLYVGFCLLARVYEGQCEDSTTIWESQR
jgi:hypothetical protein